MEHAQNGAYKYRGQICTRWGGGGSQIDFATSKYFGHKCTANNYANSMAEFCSGGVHFKTTFTYILWSGRVGVVIITNSNFDFKCIVGILNFVIDFVFFMYLFLVLSPFLKPFWPFHLLLE